MSRTYLDLCKAIVSELGIAGGTGPSAVTGQRTELKNIVDWVADADLYVQNLWSNWNFLWTEASGTVTAGESEIITLTNMRSEIEDGLLFDPGTNGAYRPKYMPWRAFKVQYETKPKRTARRPDHWSRTPAGIIKLSQKTASNLDFSMDYHALPTRMSANGSISPIPTPYDRIILCRAKLIYSEREDAPEITAGASAEYLDILEKLESFALPNQQDVRSSAAQVRDPVIV